MASMTLALFFAVLCCSVIADSSPKLSYDIPINKNLNNGDDVPLDIVVHLKAELGNLNEDSYRLSVDFDYEIPDGTEISSLTLYFASVTQEIAEISFTNGSMEQNRWEKPYVYAGGEDPINDDGIDVNIAHVIIPKFWLPSAPIKGISASVTGKDKDGLEFIYNYYGLKNYAISRPDRYVVQNYMPVK